MGERLDDPLDRLIRGSLKAAALGEVRADCLDAEALAAWTEGGLSETARVRADVHLSSCARCQAALAILARTADSPSEPLPWWSARFATWRWLVPITASAAAIAVYVAVQDRPPSPSPAVTPSATAAVDAAKPQLEQPAASPAQERAAPAETDSDRKQAPAEREQAKPDAAAREEGFADGRQKAAANEAPAKSEAVAVTDQFAKVAEEAPPAAAPAAPAATTAASSAVGRAAPQALESSADAARRLDETRDRSGGAAIVFSQNPAVRWSIGQAGAVSLSTDGGTTWTLVPSGVTTDLTAGSSPSGSICWIVGRSGTVLLTTNGRQFVRLPFPNTADLAAVRPTDASTATVTTADRRSFRTTDGGRTWSQVPLQEF
jgi:hypothetical protein